MEEISSSLAVSSFLGHQQSNEMLRYKLYSNKQGYIKVTFNSLNGKNESVKIC